MSRFGELDAQCLRSIAAYDPITLRWGGINYDGANGGRVTSKELQDGGFLAEYDASWVADAGVFESVTPPTEQQVIELYVNTNGTPCHESETGATLKRHRIERVGRAGGGLHFWLRTDKR